MVSLLEIESDRLLREGKNKREIEVLCGPLKLARWRPNCKSPQPKRFAKVAGSGPDISYASREVRLFHVHASRETFNWSSESRDIARDDVSLYSWSRFIVSCIEFSDVGRSSWRYSAASSRMRDC